MSPHRSNKRIGTGEEAMTFQSNVLRVELQYYIRSLISVSRITAIIALAQWLILLKPHIATELQSVPDMPKNEAT